ncbi:TonB-dependent receptor [Flavivirga sp. 57AJ16]|uniref:SusC/RagA family TonB-linked outer membrane protein n=1 Tax=Flavivirga sp. 57AJ16 TaxID=3025307 RepID=UPI00236739B6|nr:TonB-dependent receptor [Flavivirga sp. 57AJ16]MDD7885251.1 TonB-dependent receptor [Flavivirga sp. 57AJ16]
MRTFILLYCVSLFSLTPSNIVSQNSKIKIKADNTLTVDEVFDLIMQQTDFKFIYPEGIFKNFSEVHVKKGIISTNKLLQQSISNGNLNIILTTDNTILVKEAKTIQQINVSGKVIDDKGIPIPGATVLIKGTAKGTSTDFDGSYSITVPNPENILVFSALGFVTQEIVVRDQTVINLIFKENLSELDEVIVVGYGTTKKKDLTGSVSSVDSKQIQEVKSQTVDGALIGQMPGVFVNAQAGGPGSGAIVNIRGLSQIIGDNQPLYVVDGVPITINPRFSDAASLGVSGNRENPLLSINPADIERVDVLKDASAAAIYGSRAASGVVVITTKRGKRNQTPRLNFSYNTTIQNTLNRYDLLNAQQFEDFLIDQGLASGVTFGNADTDWQDETTNKNAIWNEYYLGVSGGSSKVNYLVSARASDQEGLMAGNKFHRYNFSSSVEADISERFKIGTNITYNYSVNRQSALTNLSRGGFFRPDQPVYNEDGSFTSISTRYGFPQYNPLGDAAKVRDKAISKNLLGSIYGEYELFKGLKFRSQLSLNLNDNKSTVFLPSYTFDSQFSELAYGTTGALLTVQNTTGISSSWSNTLNYKNTFAQKHTFDVVAGISYDYSNLELDAQYYSGFPDDDILTDIGSSQGVYNYRSDYNENALNSIFGRVNYNYDNRYLATFTARYDGSIKFGPDNKYGFFPSAALAWNVHNEDFFKDNNLFSQLKLRASLGRTGSDNLPAYSYLSYYGALPLGESNYDGINGIVVEGVPNTEIRWEKTDQLDLGVEFGFFSNRLQGEIVYFEKKTSDIILLVPLSAETGASVWNANIADVTNKGWEFLIGADIIQSKHFNWNSSFNISFIDNNVDALNGGNTSASGSIGIMEGQPIGFIYGYQVDKIAQTQEEIDALNTAAPDGNYFSSLREPGDYIFRDLNGDGEITADDQEPLGDINPDYFGGWNNLLSYKNWDFSLNFNFVKGVDRQWRRADDEFSTVNADMNKTTNIYNTWTPDNTDAYYARMGSGTHVTTSRIVEDASYIKLRSASISYNVNPIWLDSSGISNVKLSLTGNNLFVITNYPGIDPESVSGQRAGLTTDAITDSGVSYPQARTITFGVNISF